MKSYKITKLFTSGILAGLTVTEATSVHMEVGFESKGILGTSGYKVVAVEELYEVQELPNN